MSGLKYVDLLVSPEEAKDVFGRLACFLHGYNADASSRVAMSFPDFREAVKNEAGKVLAMPQAGSRMRLFGQEAALCEFLESGPVRRLQRLGVASASEPAAVPEGVGSERFARDRSVQKTHRGSSYERRMIARAKERGGEYRQKARGVLPVVRLEVVSRSTANIPKPEGWVEGADQASSSRWARPFLLDVSRREASPGDSWLARVNSYGLAGEGSCTPKF